MKLTFLNAKYYLRAQARVIAMGKRLRKRAEARGAPVERLVYSHLLRKAEKCAYCRKVFRTPATITLMEWDPVRGHVAGNVVPVHGDCKKIHQSILKDREEDRAKPPDPRPLMEILKENALKAGEGWEEDPL